MMRKSFLAVFLLFTTFSALAQSTTAVLVGRVTSVGGDPLEGAVVTITSPALQGARTAQTSVNGTFAFPSIPPGAYRVTFAMSGLQTIVKSAELQLAETTRVDAELFPLLTEEIVVTPVPLPGLETQQVSANVSQEFINILPIGRAIVDIARLAPGVHDSGPRRQLTINGAHSTDNLWLVNGAVISEGRRNQPQNLFIEDAIQETTVLTAGVSAEYGRFTGGVISVITKQGGNDMSGSLRDTLTSDEWIARTRFDPEPLDIINHDYEGTVGGRILRDRLWFFGAGRYAERRVNRQTALTEIPYVEGSDERRWEAKITGNLGASQTIVASYLDVDSIQLNARTNPPGDLRSLFDVDSPFSLLAAHYSAVLASAATIEAQFTRKEYTLSAGGSDRTFTGGTQIQDFQNNLFVWAPTFCNVCGPNYRDNREALLKTTWFFSRPRWGTHSIVAGVNDFHELAADSSNQSANDFAISTVTRLVDGQLYVMMIPGESSLEWYPILFPSRGDDFATRSAYVNDRFDWGSRLTFNVGLRFDQSRGRDQGGSQQARDSRWSPRLGAIWDIGANGSNRVSASFSRYAAKVDQFVAKAATPAGDPWLYSWIYNGEEINTGDELLPTEEVLKLVNAWFQAMGGTNATDLADIVAGPSGYVVEDKLKAPVMDEFAVGYGKQFGSSAYVRADVIRRRWHDFYTYRVTTETGRLTDAAGNVWDRVVIENSNEGLRRKYDGVTLQGQWKRGDFVLGGNYTLSRLRGNVEQETAGSGTTAIQRPGAYFPEYTGFANFAPMGYLSGDERHRGNLWTAYTLPTRFGRFTGSLLQTYHSGRRYNATATIDVRPFVKNPGYLGPPVPSYYFRPRGSLQLDGISATSIALNYAKVIRRVEAFVETDVLNVFNEQGVENAVISSTVRTSRNDRNLVPFDPFTATPIECPQGTPTSSAQCKGIANYQLNPSFGQPSSREAYQTPRTVRVSVGLRF